MSEQTPVWEEGGELLALARERQFDALEAKWMERLEVYPPRDVEELFSVAEYLVRKKQAEPAALLLWSLVATISEKGELGDALAAAVRAAAIAPEAATLREELAALCRKSVPGVPEIEELLAVSGIRSGNVRDAVRCLEHCLRLRPGAFVIHVRSRRIGRVVGFQEGAFAIESERAVQNLPPAEAVAQWEMVDAEDFRPLAVFEPERLRRLAAEDPVRLVEKALQACGGRADFKQLKALLIPAVLSAEGWSAWWNSARVVLRRSPRIGVGEGTQPQFALRAEGIGYDERLRASFGQADLFEKVKIVLGYLAELDAGHEGNPALAVEWAGELLRAGRDAADPAAALAALAAAAEIRARYAQAPDPTPELARRAADRLDAAAVIQGAPSEDIARTALASLKSACPGRFPEILAAAFPAASLRLCDWISRELARAGRDDLLAAACAKVAESPDQAPEAFGWVWRRALSAEGAVPALADRVAASVSLLELIHRLPRAPRHAGKRSESLEILGKLRNLIQAGDCRLMRDLVAKTDAAAARRLHQAIVVNEGLPGEAHLQLLNALREKHPEEFAEKKPLWEDGWVYSTAPGLTRRQAEMEKLINVDMLLNSQEIGKAAERGDLSDNAEFRAALEQRDRLTERANAMRDELRHARVLDPAAISGEEVNVGTTIRLRHTGAGKESSMTFLGPWDADLQRHIYSYLAPLSLRLMGKKKGDRVRASFDAGEEEYEIVAIEKAV